MPQDFDRGYFSGKLKSLQEIIRICEQLDKQVTTERKKAMDELRKQDNLSEIKKQIDMKRIV